MFNKVNLISHRLSRRKTYAENEEGDLLESHSGTGPKLLRILNLFDLTFLGIGSTLGVGIYVLAGSVAKDLAGPAVCLSFLIAAVASGIAALCYAEFGARVPKAGSAYVYSYVTVGEFIAFVIGWNLILEYLIGSASVARALSLNVDAMSNHSMSRLFTLTTPIHVPFMSAYADWLSMSVTLLMTIVLAVGVKSTSLFTNTFTILNLSVVVFVITAGATYAKPENWVLSVNETLQKDNNVGMGGFFPYGVSGVMAGAAKCFFGFVGFDSIAAAGEEAKNPKRNIPLSIVLTLVVVLIAYVGVSVVLTLMIPYYAQDKDTPLIHAFQQVGHSWAAWIVTVGSAFGLAASLLGAMIPMPRVVYAMAKDGLLLRCLAAVHPRFKTPFTATILTGSIAAIFAMVTDLDSLVEMMSIGTLLAYTLVAVSILILRYEWNPLKHNTTSLDAVLPWQREPTEDSSKKSKIIIFVLCILIVISCTVLASIQKSQVYHAGLIILLLSTAIAMLGLVLYLCFLPRAISRVYFMVPFVPLIPAISIWINMYLMFQLSLATWLRFIVWMAVGLLVYGGYGASHSTLERESVMLSAFSPEDDNSPLVNLLVMNEDTY
ncbi:cationic amino acid transporter 3-like isoform X1 [Daphnia pulicaria]|uniref:cationic amino acid transporter 3-like isoform X1 n=1 Tax=Daphnia pulicaria TaxID=35523 RepID=UPI001EE9BC86|nr:cationic amino acid transporter 3-like isoform X1 [Daphnia pulicaria]